MEEKTCQYSKEEVRAYINEHFPYEKVITILEKCEYDLDRFFSDKLNEAIQDEEFYISLLVDLKPDLSEYFYDLANGYWNLPVGHGKLSDLARSLWNAHTDADIWEIVLSLPSSVACELFHCYTGKAQIDGHYPVYLTNPDKAREMIEYMLYHVRD